MAEPFTPTDVSSASCIRVRCLVSGICGLGIRVMSLDNINNKEVKVIKKYWIIMIKKLLLSTIMIINSCSPPPMCLRAPVLQGYLAHKKQPPPIGPP